MATGQDFGVYVPTTDVWDTSQIQSLKDESEQLKELLIRLYQNLNRLSTAANLKGSAIYDIQEFVDGSSWFQTTANTTDNPSSSSVYRPERRLVINFGALPNTGTKSVAHKIPCTTSTSFTRIYATATNPVSTFSYIPIPYSSTVSVNDNIELYVDGTNVNITTAADYSAYTICYVVLEYLQT